MPIIIILSMLIITFVISYIAYKMAFYNDPNKEIDLYDSPVVSNDESCKKVMNSLIDEFKVIPYEEICITSFDGLKLKAKYYHLDDKAPIQIQCHGYKGCGIRDMSGGNKLAREANYNTLVISHRAHDGSGGKSITFGIKERQDVLSWVNYLNERFQSQNKIILVGVSMGAATVLMCSELNLPSNVKAIIADCPYDDIKQEIKVFIKKMKLPPTILYPFVYLGSFIFAKFKINETSPLQAVKNSKVPILLIHGEEDDVVPLHMSNNIYNANKEKVEYHTFKNAKHGLSYIIDPKRYEEITLDFLSKHLTIKEK